MVQLNRSSVPSQASLSFAAGCLKLASATDWCMLVSGDNPTLDSIHFLLGPRGYPHIYAGVTNRGLKVIQ